LKTSLAAGAALAAAPARVLGAEPARLTFAFVGCAHIHTPGFIGLLKSRPEVRVKYVWDHNSDRATKRANELGARPSLSVGEVMEDPGVQAVVICSETRGHAELVAAATAAKKALFVEKPLGMNAKESHAMAAQIEKAGVPFTTGYFMRTDPKHLFLKEQLAAGAFGQVTRVSGWNCHSGSLGGWFDAKPGDIANNWRWMADPDLAGVGAFGDLGTHSLDILMWLVGDVAAATADIKVVTGRYGDCDEAGQGLLRFKSGVNGTLTAGWVDVANPLTLLIAGTEGHAWILNDQLFFLSAKVPGADGKQPWTKLPTAPPAPLHQFVNAVAGQPGQPLVTPREAAARVAAMEALYKGWKTGKWVKPA
jgi:predicted dehydrogenase